jgi:hypothetical protein
MAENSDNNAYWAANIRLVTICLVIWALASFGFGILLRPLSAGIEVAEPIWASGLPSRDRSSSSCPDLLLRLAHELDRQEVRRGRRIRDRLNHGSDNTQHYRGGRVVRALHRYRDLGPCGLHVEFYAAGRGVNPVTNGMATAADWMSAASFISMAGLIAFVGYNNSLFLMGWTGGYVLLAMLLAPYLRKFGKFTVPEFIGDRYYSNRARRGGGLPHRHLGDLRYRSDDRCGVAFSPLPRSGSTTTGLFIGSACRSRLRRARRHEGHHLHPGGAVLRADRGLHHPGDLHLAAADRQPDPGSWPVLRHDR